MYDGNDDPPPAAWTWRWFAWWGQIAIGFVVLIGIIVGGIWLFNVATSGTKGKGDITRERNGAANITKWSTVFHGLSEQIQADLANIKIDAAAANGPNATRQDLMDLNGAEKNCSQDVAQYDGYLKDRLAVVPDDVPSSYPLDVCTGG